MSDKAETLKQFRLDTLIAELRAREAREKTPDDTDRVPIPALEKFRSRELIDFIRDQQRTIYGTDDRQEVFTLASQPALFQSADSVVAIFKASDIQDQGDGTSKLKTQPLGTRYPDLCRSEKFIDQPVGGGGSGFLVAEDVIATAGHCVDDTTVAQMRFVFGFRMINATTAPTKIPNGEIYRGERIIDRQPDTLGADW